MNPQLHVTGVISDVGIRVCVAILEEMLHGLNCSLRAMFLLGSECVQRMQHCGVNSSGVIKKNSTHLFEHFAFSGRHW